MKLALAIAVATGRIAAAEPAPTPHALVTLGASRGVEDQNTTRTIDLTLAGRATPALWGFVTGRAGSSDHACGDCIGDGKLREGDVGVLYLPCHATLCVGGSAALGYARREIYYPGGRNALGETFPSSYQVEDWLIADGRLRLMLRLGGHVAVEGDVALRYQRRLFDPTYPNAGGALASIALGAWL